jgi:hypothetical protein
MSGKTIKRKKRTIKGKIYKNKPRTRKNQRKHFMHGGLRWKFWKNVTDEDKKRKMADLKRMLPLPTKDQVDVSQYKTPIGFKSRKFNSEFLKNLKEEYFNNYKSGYNNGYADYHNCVHDNLFYYDDDDERWKQQDRLLCEWKDNSQKASEWRADFFANSVFIDKGKTNYMQYFTMKNKPIYAARGLVEEDIDQREKKDLTKNNEVMGYDIPDDIFYLYIDTLEDPTKLDLHRDTRYGRTDLYKLYFNDNEKKEEKEMDTLINKVNAALNENLNVHEYNSYGIQVKTKATLLIEQFDSLQLKQAKYRVENRAYENDRTAPATRKTIQTPRYRSYPVPTYLETYAPTVRTNRETNLTRRFDTPSPSSLPSYRSANNIEETEA